MLDVRAKSSGVIMQKLHLDFVTQKPPVVMLWTPTPDPSFTNFAPKPG